MTTFCAFMVVFTETMVLMLGACGVNNQQSSQLSPTTVTRAAMMMEFWVRGFMVLLLVDYRWRLKVHITFRLCGSVEEGFGPLIFAKLELSFK